MGLRCPLHTSKLQAEPVPDKLFKMHNENKAKRYGTYGTRVRWNSRVAHACIVCKSRVAGRYSCLRRTVAL